MSGALLIIGAGGHAAVLADALIATSEPVLGFTDAAATMHGRERCGLRVLGGDSVLSSYDRQTVRLINGIGGIGRKGDDLRQRVQERLEVQGWSFVGVRHPAAIVSRFAQVEADAQLLAGAIVQAGARIGRGAIVNTAAVIEHDAVLGEWSQAAPRALLCGDVRTGAHCHVGAGAVLRQGIVLGDAVVVGAGAVVVRDFAGPGLLLGVPAATREARA